MTCFPEELSSIVRKAAETHSSDINKAEDCAYKAWKKSPKFDEWIEPMVRGQLRSMIHDARSSSTNKLRRDLGEYEYNPKVARGGLDTVGSVLAKSVLDLYYIDGRVLGDLLGEELDAIAAGEEARADGHLANARLCRALKPLVPKDKTVRESVTEQKAHKLIEQSNKGK